jgi:hypothetical protein
MAVGVLLTVAALQLLALLLTLLRTLNFRVDQLSLLLLPLNLALAFPTVSLALPLDVLVVKSLITAVKSSNVVVATTLTFALLKDSVCASL